MVDDISGEVQRNDLAVERTDLARERNLLANERTFSAWIRTGLAMVVAGLAAGRLLFAGDQSGIPCYIAALLILTGGCVFALALWRYIATYHRLRGEGLNVLPLWMLTVLVVVLCVCAALALLLVLSPGPAAGLAIGI